MVTITKANGEKEEFSEEKLLHSIRRAGIPKSLDEEVMNHIKSRLHEGMTTGEIYYHINEFLGKSPHQYTKARYGLKQAIMELGPTGYPFEDFIARILNKKGYTTKLRTLMQGRCITHEIDVIAEKHTVLPNKIMVEAKFHNQVGIHTNVHVALYTKARFDDIKDKHQFSEAWLVTNTKASIDAIAYANCVRMNLVSWSYPDGGSLRDWVEQYHMYPVTVLTTLSPAQKQQLLEKGVILCQDIQENASLLDILILPEQTKNEIIQEVSFVSHHASSL
jgi:Holliday junction resolvase-like predicted endonuclease